MLQQGVQLEIRAIRDDATAADGRGDIDRGTGAGGGAGRRRCAPCGRK